MTTTAALIYVHAIALAVPASTVLALLADAGRADNTANLLRLGIVAPCLEQASSPHGDDARHTTQKTNWKNFKTTLANFKTLFSKEASGRASENVQLVQPHLPHLPINT